MAAETNDILLLTIDELRSLIKDGYLKDRECNIDGVPTPLNVLLTGSSLTGSREERSKLRLYSLKEG